MATVIVKRVTLPNSKKQVWQIIGQIGDIPEGLVVGINGGYAGLFRAVADYPHERGIASARARIVRLWQDYVSDEGVEKTQFAEVEIII